MSTTFILKEIVKELRRISSETSGTADIWVCDQLVTYIINMSNKTEVKEATLIIEIEKYMFKFKFEHILKSDESYYNHLISFTDTEGTIYQYEPNISVNEKKVEVL